LATLPFLWQHNVNKGVKYLKENKKFNTFMECLKRKSRWENGEEFKWTSIEQRDIAFEGSDMNSTCRRVFCGINRSLVDSNYATVVKRNFKKHPLMKRICGYCERKEGEERFLICARW
jgi:hypothetical protein